MPLSETAGRSSRARRARRTFRLGTRADCARIAQRKVDRRCDFIDRAYSHYQMTRRERASGVFAEAVDAEEARLAPEVARSAADRRYNSWPLGCWSYLNAAATPTARALVPAVPARQFHFVKNEDLLREPRGDACSVHDFLELPPHDKQDSKFHVASYSGMTPETRAIRRLLQPSERLYELVGIDFGWERDATPAAAASTS
jgi:hypothetical protein